MCSSVRRWQPQVVSAPRGGVPIAAIGLMMVAFIVCVVPHGQSLTSSLIPGRVRIASPIRTSSRFQAGFRPWVAPAAKNKGFGSIPSQAPKPVLEKEAEPKTETRITARDDFERAALSGSKMFNDREDAARMDQEFSAIPAIQVFITLLLFGALAFFAGFLLMDCLALCEPKGAADGM